MNVDPRNNSSTISASNTTKPPTTPLSHSKRLIATAKTLGTPQHDSLGADSNGGYTMPKDKTHPLNLFGNHGLYSFPTAKAPIKQ